MPTTSKTIITITPPKSIKSIFQDVVRYPERKVSKSSRKKEEVPTVITSDKWVENHSLKEQIKQEKERDKEQRKATREQERKETALQNEKKKKIKS